MIRKGSAQLSPQLEAIAPGAQAVLSQKKAAWWWVRGYWAGTMRDRVRS